MLTPFGLRTLSLDDPSYIGLYRRIRKQGLSLPQRDSLAMAPGPYVKAYRKVHNYSKKSLEDMRALLQGFDSHLETAGIGTISEVFDGDFPHSPGGCIAQAWSVAEILRAYVEDVLGIKP